MHTAELPCVYLDEFDGDGVLVRYVGHAHGTAEAEQLRASVSTLAPGHEIRFETFEEV